MTRAPLWLRDLDRYGLLRTSATVLFTVALVWVFLVVVMGGFG